nr:hypothetical protein Iba_chr12bCG6640 [Ipomoea batatas]
MLPTLDLMLWISEATLCCDFKFLMEKKNLHRKPQNLLDCCSAGTRSKNSSMVSSMSYATSRTCLTQTLISASPSSTVSATPRKAITLSSSSLMYSISSLSPCSSTTFASNKTVILSSTKTTVHSAICSASELPCIEVQFLSSITHKKFKMDKIRQVLQMFKWIILEFTPLEVYFDEVMKRFNPMWHLPQGSRQVKVLKKRRRQRKYDLPVKVMDSTTLHRSIIVELHRKDQASVYEFNEHIGFDALDFRGNHLLLFEVPNEEKESPHDGAESIRLMISWYKEHELVNGLGAAMQHDNHPEKHEASCFCQKLETRASELPRIEVQSFSSITHKKFKMDKVASSLRILSSKGFEEEEEVKKESLQLIQFPYFFNHSTARVKINICKFLQISQLPYPWWCLKTRAKAVIEGSPFIDVGPVLCSQNTSNGHNCKRQSPTSFQDLL